MKKYCFNYSIQGALTFLPLWICVEDSNHISAFMKAKKYLKQTEKRNTKVHFKNFPEPKGQFDKPIIVPKNFK